MGALEDKGRACLPNVRQYFISKGHNVQIKDAQMNPMFAIDTETTGLNWKEDEIIDICLLPLNNDSTINEDHRPFNMFIKPTKPAQDSWPMFMKRNHDRATKLGCTRKQCVEAFIDWLARLNLGGLKIAPVGHNYAGFDQPFLKEFFSHEAYNSCFDYHVFDTMCMANLLNLRALRKSEKPPFPRVNLGAVATALNIVPDLALEHTAYGDCITVAKVLNKLCTRLD